MTSDESPRPYSSFDTRRSSLVIVRPARALARPRRAGGILAVAAEGARRGELAQLVPDHRLVDEDRHVPPAVVDGDRVPDHVREDRRVARPGADHPALVVRVEPPDLLAQARVDERTLLR